MFFCLSVVVLLKYWKLVLTSTCITITPVGDEPLTPDDAVNVLEEILGAQNQSYELGLKLKLPLHIVEGIHSTYSHPRDRLLQVIIEFTKQVDPRPTWRAIVSALRSHAVNLPQLANIVEAAHLPDLGKGDTIFRFVKGPSKDFFSPVKCMHVVCDVHNSYLG